MNLEPGTLVNANLRLLRRIGEGGMGSVWVAEHLALDIEVAIKFMAPELASNPDMTERFKREAKSVAQMRSPHIVRIFDYAAPRDGAPYMVMELLEGEDLESHVSRHGRLSLKDTVDVVTQIAKALREAHALGIVHRDVKPENVFLASCSGEPFVKVLDFGIAKQARESAVRVTCSGTTIGTPIYMSPEQILSAKDVDYRCDLWSLAVVAYFCLTGRVPFEGETYGAVCIAIDRGRMTPPSELRSEVPREVDAWFAKALARDIGARFRSAQEMTEAFVAAMSGATAARSLPLALARFAWRPPVSWSFRAPIPRRRTLAGTTIARIDRGNAARARVTTFASVVAMALLFAGGLDLGRAWFGRASSSHAAAFVAAPPLARTEPARSDPPPPIVTPSPLAAIAPPPVTAKRRVKVADVLASAAQETPERTRPHVAIPPGWTAAKKAKDAGPVRAALATEETSTEPIDRDAGPATGTAPLEDSLEITPASTAPPDDSPVGL